MLLKRWLVRAALAYNDIVHRGIQKLYCLDNLFYHKFPNICCWNLVCWKILLYPRRQGITWNEAVDTYPQSRFHMHDGNPCKNQRNPSLLETYYTGKAHSDMARSTTWAFTGFWISSSLILRVPGSVRLSAGQQGLQFCASSTRCSIALIRPSFSNHIFEKEASTVLVQLWYLASTLGKADSWIFLEVRSARFNLAFTVLHKVQHITYCLLPGHRELFWSLCYSNYSDIRN